MSRLSRRSLPYGRPFAVPLLPHAALAGVWVEVTGSAIIHNAADHDAARRRALADALLAAAFAGGANVQGHSAMSLGRMTSDMLVVRPCWPDFAGGNPVAKPVGRSLAGAYSRHGGGRHTNRLPGPFARWC